MLNELKEVKAIWQSGGRPSEEQLEALVSALTEKESREPLEDLENDIWVALKVASLFKNKDLWELIESALSREGYYNEKKAKYFLYFQAGDHHFEGDFFYWLTFKHEITRREFERILEAAEKPNDRYASLSDPEFQEQYGILSFEEFRPDYLGGLEPIWVTVDRDGNIIPEEEVEMEPEDWDWEEEPND